jgi:hypothetical protein
MDEYTPCKKSDPTARMAIGNADRDGFRTVRMMSEKELARHRKQTQLWNARKEEEKRRMIQKRREKLRRQNAELLMRVNYVLRAGLKIKEFTRCVSLDYSGQVNAIEIRELERIGESVGAAYERIEKIVNAIVDRNTERHTV